MSDAFEREVFRVVEDQLIRRTPGVTGHTSSLQVETAMSAHPRHVYLNN
jgi:hypothetical protein